MFTFPVAIVKYLAWYSKWVYDFNIKKKPYEEEDKLYLIRKNLGLSELQFNAVEDHTKLEYLRKKLWIKENFKVWKEEQEAEMKASMADNPRYKAYRRYMKNHGPGRITFED